MGVWVSQGEAHQEPRIGSKTCLKQWLLQRGDKLQEASSIDVAQAIELMEPDDTHRAPIQKESDRNIARLVCTSRAIDLYKSQDSIISATVLRKLMGAWVSHGVARLCCELQQHTSKTRSGLISILT